MAQGSNIGMMEGAFFVPRGELLDWINSLLELNVTKVEHLASGAAYCSVVDALFPGTVAMSRVNWMARNDFEFVQNYKVLQQAFEKNGVDKWIDVDKLIRGKYQDNLEFVQWLKRFFDLNGGAGKEYNAVARRKNASTLWDTAGRVTQPKKQPSSSSGSGGSVPASKPSKAVRPAGQNSSSKETLQREKDFYFSKLRAIELYCQHHSTSDDPHLAEITKVLYATDDEEITVTPDGEIQVAKQDADADA